MDEWAFVLIVALCIAIGGLSHRGDTLAQAILTVAPSRLGGWWGPDPPWFYEPFRRTLSDTETCSQPS